MKNPKNVYYSSEEELRKIGNLTLRQRNSILMNRELENAKRIIEQCEKHRISLLPIENPLYPKRAGNCNDAPIILYYKGTIQRMDKTVGIVGARRCTLGNQEGCGRIGGGVYRKTDCSYQWDGQGS
ncbi:MAG: DNA-processing protein DprA [Blautia faecis]